MIFQALPPHGAAALFPILKLSPYARIRADAAAPPQTQQIRHIAKPAANGPAPFSNRPGLRQAIAQAASAVPAAHDKA